MHHGAMAERECGARRSLASSADAHASSTTAGGSGIHCAAHPNLPSPSLPSPCAVLYFYLSWTDPAAYPTARAATDRWLAGNASCAHECSDWVHQEACCDGLYQPTFFFRNALAFPQARPGSGGGVACPAGCMAALHARLEVGAGGAHVLGQGSSRFPPSRCRTAPRDTRCTPCQVGSASSCACRGWRWRLLPASCPASTHGSHCCAHVPGMLPAPAPPAEPNSSVLWTQTVQATFYQVGAGTFTPAKHACTRRMPGGSKQRSALSAPRPTPCRAAHPTAVLPANGPVPLSL